MDFAGNIPGDADKVAEERRLPQRILSDLPPWYPKKERDRLEKELAAHTPVDHPRTRATDVGGKLASGAKAVGNAALAGLGRTAEITSKVTQATTQVPRAGADLLERGSKALGDKSQGKHGRGRIHLDKAFEAVGLRIELATKPFRSKKAQDRLKDRSDFEKEIQHEKLGKEASTILATGLAASGLIGTAMNISNTQSSQKPVLPAVAVDAPQHSLDLAPPTPEQKYETARIGIARTPAESPKPTFVAAIKKTSIPDRAPGVYTEPDGSKSFYVNIKVGKIHEALMVDAAIQGYQAYDIYYDLQTDQVLSNSTIVDYIGKELADKIGLSGERANGSYGAEIDLSSLPSHIVPVIINRHPTFDKVVFRFVKDGSPFMDDVFGGINVAIPKDQRNDEGAMEFVVDMHSRISYCSFMEPPERTDSPEQAREKVESMIDEVNISMDSLRDYQNIFRASGNSGSDSALRYNPALNYARIAEDIKTKERYSDDTYAGFIKYIASITPPYLDLPEPGTSAPIPNLTTAAQGTAMLLHEIADFAVSGGYIAPSPSASR